MKPYLLLALVGCATEPPVIDITPPAGTTSSMTTVTLTPDEPLRYLRLFCENAPTCAASVTATSRFEDSDIAPANHYMLTLEVRRRADGDSALLQQFLDVSTGQPVWSWVELRPHPELAAQGDELRVRSPVIDDDQFTFELRRDAWDEQAGEVLDVPITVSF